MFLISLKCVHQHPRQIKQFMNLWVSAFLYLCAYALVYLNLRAFLCPRFCDCVCWSLCVLALSCLYLCFCLFVCSCVCSTVFQIVKCRGVWDPRVCESSRECVTCEAVVSQSTKQTNSLEFAPGTGGVCARGGATSTLTVPPCRASPSSVGSLLVSGL